MLQARVRSNLMVMVLAAAAVGSGLAAFAPSASAQFRSQQEDAFNWSGAIGAGNRIMIKNINGPIRVERSNSGRVEVSAQKQWRRGDPDVVRIEQPRIGGGDVLICAMWKPESHCDVTGIHTPRGSWRSNDNNDVSVHFVVRVPEGVRVDVSTVNGSLEVNGVTTEIDANTVNGTIEAHSAGGPVRAKTVNGSIRVSMTTIGNAEELEYETTNGSITLDLPSNFGAQMELSTVNGRVTTDFPITIVGSFSPRKLRGTIGNGATRVSASTVNGSVTLRRN